MQNRDHAIDFIRLAAILGVVIIHISTAFIDRSTPSSFNFYLYVTINQFVRFAVPLFFAISGVLLGARYSNIASPIEFYRKRFIKIILPYFVWVLIYYLLVFPHSVNKLFSAKFLHNLYQGDASYQLYFVPAIIVLYFFFPIIVAFKRIFLTSWFIISLFIFEAFILTNVYLSRTPLPLDTPFRVAIYNALPFIVGLYVGVGKINISKVVKKYFYLFFPAWILLIAAVILETFATYYLSGKSYYLRAQWRISVMLYGIMSGAIFYYFYPKFLSNLDKQINYLSRFSFGVFFVHVAILDFVLTFFINKYNLVSPIYFVLTAAIVIIGSFAFSIILSKNKLLDRILGLRS